MKRIHVISIFVCLGIAASAAAGDLWINCEAGFDIYLDGELAGVSDKTEFGLRLYDHNIRWSVRPGTIVVDSIEKASASSDTT